MIGVGLPEGARWTGRSAAVLDAVPGRLCTPIAASWQSVDSVSEMAAKTTSGSGSDRKFGLVAPGFLMLNAFLYRLTFLDVYR